MKIFCAQKFFTHYNSHRHSLFFDSLYKFLSTKTAIANTINNDYRQGYLNRLTRSQSPCIIRLKPQQFIPVLDNNIAVGLQGNMTKPLKEENEVSF